MNIFNFFYNIYIYIYIMSFWDSKNLPTYNLNGGFMLPQMGFRSDFTPGGMYLNLPQPPTSTSAPAVKDSDDENAVTKMLSRLGDAASGDSYRSPRSPSRSRSSS